MFFNVDQDAAWLVNIGLSNVYNHGKNNVSFTLQNAGAVTETVSDLNRTYANIGLGRECYLRGTAGCEGPSCALGSRRAGGTAPKR